MRSHSKLLGGILLVSGTTIGAGMLALPVVTGQAGFFISLLLFVAFWIYMTFTAFLMLEVNLWMNEHANLISMAKKTLGRWGEAISWITYLFLLYSLTTAYLAGGGPIFIDFVKSFTGYTLPSWAGSAPLLIIFGFFVYKGTRSVDYVNRLLMIGLVIAYLAMVALLMPHVETQLLNHVDWTYMTLGVAIIATSFGFHIIIPTLTSYLERDIPKLKKTILIGSAIPLVVYILWEILALGIIPLQGQFGVFEGYREGTNGVHLLTGILGNSAIAMIARFFSFFAIITSFLGVSLSLNDFLADGLKIEKTRSGRALLYLLTFLPPLLFTLWDPRAFLTALDFAGAFGVVILLGLLPPLMVWQGRYHKHFESTFKAPGGKIALVIAVAFSALVIGIDILNRLEFITL
jgi:tyrosine-specific transport protein